MKKLLIFFFIVVLAHTAKDFFQDFLETDFLYFVDANENLMALPKWGRWVLVVANQAADIIAWPLVLLTPIAIIKNQKVFQKILLVVYFLFFIILTTDLTLDPRITNPKLFFDKPTRIPASQMKAKYQEILRQGPF
ncbi:hypothetical protein HYU89_01685 [Candidatus Collierbacteria bacterium]|nr:hypothetical protein [Candidatus Collierbacteria bacterium]